MKNCEYIAHIRKDGTIQTCNEHSESSADISRASLSKCGFNNVAYLAGLLHDCGKYTPEFTEYIKKASSGQQVRKGEVIHSFAGMKYLYKNYHDTDDFYEIITAELLAYAIGAHHGLFDVCDENHYCQLIERLKKQPDYDDRAIIAFLNECRSKEDIDKLFTNAVKEIKTCIEKESEFFGSDWDLIYISFLSRLIASAVMHGDRTDTASFMMGEPDDLIRGNSALWKQLSVNFMSEFSKFSCKTKIQKARSELSDICAAFDGKDGAIYRLNLPTGGGKTLSSLRFALSHAEKYNKSHIYYIAPLISIIEQNADVWKQFLGKEYVLEHHSNIVEDDEEENSDEKRRILQESWDSPVIVTTLVQFLNTLFADKTSCVRRMQALTNSVIIIDEVQTIPPKMINPVNCALNFLACFCNSTIILCSATQPSFEITESPLQVSDKSFLTPEQEAYYFSLFKRTDIEYKGDKSTDAIADMVYGLIEEYGSVLVVCNIKEQATELYELINIQNCNKYHLSSSMCIAHRRKVVEEMHHSLKDGLRTICVSTQVIEAGVDISFGAVIRYCAGLDSIVQSAGRCNRNGTSAISPVYIIKKNGENLSKMREIEEGKKATIDLVYEFGKAPQIFEGDLSSLKSVDKYYRFLYDRMSKGYRDYIKDGNHPSLFSLLSDNEQYVDERYPETICLRHAMKTAGQIFEVIGSDSKSVIVPYEDGEAIIDEMAECSSDDYAEIKRLLMLAKPYTVSIFPGMFKRMKDEGIIYPLCDGLCYAVMPGYYDENKGLLQKRSDEICNTLIL